MVEKKNLAEESNRHQVVYCFPSGRDHLDSTSCEELH
jgi:hypothetical protein